MGKDKEKTLQIMSAVKELMWVVIDIIYQDNKVNRRTTSPMMSLGPESRLEPKRIDGREDRSPGRCSVLGHISEDWFDGWSLALSAFRVTFLGTLLSSHLYHSPFYHYNNAASLHSRDRRQRSRPPRLPGGLG